MLKKVTYNGESFNATPKQIQALETLTSTNAGGFAVIHDYVSTSKRIKPETADITFVSRFSYERMNKRKLAALEALTLDDIKADCKHEKLTALDEPTLDAEFNKRKSYLIESINKTLSGDRSDSRRQAHDRCYCRIAEGIRVHYKTVEDSHGIMQPVLLDGAPIAETILIEAIEISRKVTVPGEYKPVNSGTQVLIGNVIMKHMPKGTKFKALSLDDDKFSSLSIAGKDMVPADVQGIF